MKFHSMAALTVALVSLLTACQTQKPVVATVPVEPPKPKFALRNENDTVSYCIGVSIGQSLKAQGLDSVNVEALATALRGVNQSDSLFITPEQANQLLSGYFQNLQAKKAEAAKQVGLKFLSENKTKPGVVTLPSGLQYQVLKEGTGAMPKATDKVTAHYRGTLVDGTVFDSSYDRNQPLAIGVSEVVPGWTEALQLMKVGAKWKLFVPSELAYGERGSPPIIAPNSALIFEMELLSIGK
ncbi:MAG: FKBP-type peptidyl-prolyl cis-trans isomerase [Ferruginibacter sp.]|nr:FKBP-type peptidyl-prolyl cis-trans isomerase [Cytophagales bacterium]